MVAFQPLPNPQTGSGSEGPADTAFAPPGLNEGLFFGFRGKCSSGGLANEENPLVHVDLKNGSYPRPASPSPSPTRAEPPRPPSMTRRLAGLRSVGHPRALLGN